MRLINTRCGWSVNGEFVKLIPPEVYLTETEMLEYYGMTPSDRNFQTLIRPHKHARIVLRRHNGNTVVAPVTEDVSEVT
jgi:hypothetical protein